MATPRYSDYTNQNQLFIRPFPFSKFDLAYRLHGLGISKSFITENQIDFL